MKTRTYTSSRGEIVDLTSKTLWAGRIDDFRSRGYGYDLGYRKIGVVTRPAREAEITVISLSTAALDEARSVFEADILSQTPGTLTVNDEWAQSAFVTASRPAYVNPDIQQVTLTFALMDGAWTREHVTAFNLQVLATGTDLDYPYDYPHDYTRMSLVEELMVPGRLPAAVRLTVYGPATNPYIVIGENKYQLNSVTVPSGGYLIVDGRAKTIEMTAANGDKTNLFAAGERGTGAGSGAYIFEPVPAGLNTVSWPNSFGFDVTVFEQSGEVPWQTLQ